MNPRTSVLPTASGFYFVLWILRAPLYSSGGSFPRELQFPSFRGYESFTELFEEINSEIYHCCEEKALLTTVAKLFHRKKIKVARNDGLKFPLAQVTNGNFQFRELCFSSRSYRGLCSRPLDHGDIILEIPQGGFDVACLRPSILRNPEFDTLQIEIYLLPASATNPRYVPHSHCVLPTFVFSTNA